MPDTTANIQTGIREFPPDQYKMIRDVPVFVEHETMSRPDKQGQRRKLKFTRRELALIADRCNRRIEETGDYAAVTLGHTPETVEKPMDLPPLAGFAGPFRAGKLPNGKAAILADFHIHAEDVPQLKRFPRRSPELWLADEYEDMFFDPISLIGAEAPRLDMGMMFYTRQRSDGQAVETYSAVFPSGANTFVPTGDELRESGKQYAAGDDGDAGPQPESKDIAMATDPGLVQEIVQAIDATDWAQWCKAMMQAGITPEKLSGLFKAEATEEHGLPGEDAGMMAEEAETKPTQFAAGDDDPEKKETTEVEVEPEKDKAPEQYAKLRDEVRQLRGLLTETKQHADTTATQLNEERALRVNAERFSKLQELRYRYTFDLDKQVERCKYGKMNSEQFQDHLDMVAENFARIPEGEMLPIPDGTARESNGRPGGVAEREKYSKQHSDEARRRCEAMVKKGQQPAYEDILAEVKAGK